MLQWQQVQHAVQEQDHLVGAPCRKVKGRNGDPFGHLVELQLTPPPLPAVLARGGWGGLQAETLMAAAAAAAEDEGVGEGGTAAARAGSL